MANEKAKKAKPDTSERKDAAKEQRRRNRGSQLFEPADWGGIRPEVLAGVICAITGVGCAVQFGYTRDGSAFVVRIVGDGEPYNEYIRPTEEPEGYLIGIIEDFRA